MKLERKYIGKLAKSYLGEIKKPRKKVLQEVWRKKKLAACNFLWKKIRQYCIMNSQSVPTAKYSERILQMCKWQCEMWNYQHFLVKRIHKAATDQESLNTFVYLSNWIWFRYYVRESYCFLNNFECKKTNLDEWWSNDP